MPQESSCLGDFSCPGDAARTAHATRRHGPPRSAATQCTRGSSISRTFPVSRRTGCRRAGPTRDHRSCAAHPTGATTSRRSTPGVGSVGRSTRARDSPASVRSRHLCTTPGAGSNGAPSPSGSNSTDSHNSNRIGCLRRRRPVLAAILPPLACGRRLRRPPARRAPPRPPREPHRTSRGAGRSLRPGRGGSNPAERCAPQHEVPPPVVVRHPPVATPRRPVRGGAPPRRHPRHLAAPARRGIRRESRGGR